MDTLYSKSKVLKLAGLAIMVIILLNGCATIPTEEALTTYDLNGVTYVSLGSLCKTRGLSWDYDTFTRIVNLNKSTHKISLQVSNTLILVDGSVQHLRHPVDIYDGEVVVPYKFKEQVLDVLFKEYQPSHEAIIPLKIKKIVVDAGHGGNDPGAIGRSGLREKSVTLDMAKRLSGALKEKGFDVTMTRSTDYFVPLERRTEIANKARADLFVSIHANANRTRSLNGFEVYYLSPNINDVQRALSSAQNADLKLDDSCFSGRSRNLKAILWDMIYTNNRGESIELSRAICKKIDAELDTRVIGIKGAGFYVLKGTRMPSVLVEIGFLSNSQEEKLLNNSYYREQIAEAIADGIYNYARDYTLMEASR